MASGRDVWWEDAVADKPGTLEAVEVDSETPYLLAYTSGTTGRPKGALHVQGGFLLSIARETAYQADLRAGDRVLFTTDMGWIMGPWTVVGGMACGASIVFMEGAPDQPHDRVWRLVEDERVTMLGVSPTLVRALIPHGEPAQDLSSLRSVLTTGEPWNRGPYDWLDEHVCGGGRIPIVNCSGGTEVGACFLSVTMLEPTKPCSVGFPALGEDVDVVDDEGRPVRGEVGELVCRRAWPGMTRGIWGDPERYLETYWRRFPGIWTHGDWASVDEDGYWFLHGRSDDTLNIAGKRIGPAELESAAVGHPADRRSGGDRHAARGEGRGRVALLCSRARRRRHGRRGRGGRLPRAREGVRARPCPLRDGPPEDAEREDRAARRTGARARTGSGRPLHAREPRSARGDRSVPSDRLEGVALVTGGGRGIGASIARELADAGMRVAVTGRTAATGRGGRERDRRSRPRRRREPTRRRRALDRAAPKRSSGRSTCSLRMQASAARTAPTWEIPVDAWWHVLRGQRARRATSRAAPWSRECSSAAAAAS